MIQFDGEHKLIILSEDFEFNLTTIYSLARAWESQVGAIVFHNPFDVSTELLFTLRYGWKFKPSGYASGKTIRIFGKLSTTEGDLVVKTVPPTTGQPVTWQFDTPATAVIVATGSGVTNQDKTEIINGVINGIGDIEVSGLSPEEREQLMSTLREDIYVKLTDI